MAQAANFNEDIMMTVCSEKAADKAPGSLQIIRHIKKIETPMKDVRDILIRILKQYQVADKMGVSLGVLDKTSSFSDHVSWCPVIAKLDKKKESLDESSKSYLRESLNYLENIVVSFEENVVMEILKFRDQWMKKVLLIDFLVVAIVAIALAATVFFSEFQLSEAVIMSALSERPFFYVLTMIMVLVAGFLLHCYIRKKVLNSMLNKNLNSLAPGMSMMRALQKNTRLRHSVFRPTPVGWNVFQKIRLNALVAQVEKLKQQLAEMLSQNTDNEEPDTKVV